MSPRTMAIYQTSKQITKFTISGIIAVFVDFAVYYSLSNMIGNSEEAFAGGVVWNDVYKGLGFIAGTFVTYNLNKFWTWRTNDRNNSRLLNFGILYLISFVINIVINKYGLHIFGDDEIALLFTRHGADPKVYFPFKTDKLFAFILATAVSSVVNFIGQKIWVFKSKPEEEQA